MHWPVCSAATAWRTWSMKEQPPTAVPSTQLRRDAQVVGERRRRLAGGGDAVDVSGADARIRKGVKRRVSVQLQLAHVRNPAELRGLRRTHHGNLRQAQDASPAAGAKSGRAISSLTCSKVTSRGMSSTSASGVCSQPTMLDMSRTPSSSSTRAMA